MPPSPASTLLFVTDFSESSVNALQWAIPEAKRNHLRLTVLYPYRLDQLRRGGNTTFNRRDLDREASEKFELHLEKLLKDSKIPFDFHPEVGFMRDRVSEHARKNNVVMLVMDGKLASLESFPELMAEISVPMVIVPSRKS